MIGYKILTHDGRSPIQGGKPVYDGTLPYELPAVPLDTSDNECGAGWNFCASLNQAATIAGWWPTGRPAQCLVVEANSAVIRGNKCRAASLRLVRRCTEGEIQQAMRALVAPWAGEHVEALTQEQWLWYIALGRPERDASAVAQGLRAALDRRGLQTWALQQFNDVRDARDAWDAWDARAAWDAWDAQAARVARDAQAAWDARDALAVYSAHTLGWPSRRDSDLLTVGLRDAYKAGLEVVVPAAPQTLGWVMVAPSNI